MKALVLAAALAASTSLYAAQFEYKLLEFNKFESVEVVSEKLNQLGSQGWELVSTEKHILTGSVVIYRYHLKKSVD